MKVAILYNEPALTGREFSEASIDVLTQVEAVERALAELEYESTRIAFTKDVGAVVQKLAEEKPHLVMNLCESVDEDPLLIGHPAAVLELLDIPFSGSPTAALMLSTDKLVSKRLLSSCGFKTPRFEAYEGNEVPALEKLNFPVIVKPRFEDASVGIDQESVFREANKLRAGLRDLFQRYGCLLIEEYIAGREFNISLFGFPVPETLPIAEIDFDGFPPDLFRIVGYRAKWDVSSFEYQHSRRTFPRLPRPLARKLEETALECFSLFGLRDYGRVDVRVDDRGRVFVLEVNANPCISPDAGFAAAGNQNDLHYVEMIDELLQFVQKRMG
ncbi:MAG: D-alanine--D-alanine ligase [Candidatus Abyssobacteria bacterium SURF_5]|uniref:D-alanine--D-alanine ligase n=1 Tax=Abyssobacteria bacterium (strain SURF_5) TaxID=2093360 RepID=A0A3A4P2S0_ABYX5|nr:MAG: D-alanine--D-alanine ligase [Candidatus Abyssubacteria bacterium SURF_5]